MQKVASTSVESNSTDGGAIFSHEIVQGLKSLTFF
jgi:hypothetical protein